MSHCDAFAAADHIPTGIFVSHAEYLKAQTTSPDCDLARPDIIYDLLNLSPKYSKELLENIESAGYTLIWRQTGFITKPINIAKLQTDAFIAVDNQQLKNINFTGPIRIKNLNIAL